MFLSNEYPHRRFNALTGEWVLVSPHRTKRPWKGQVEKLPQDDKTQYDPDCYLCPGNGRAEGKTNPPYESVHVFTNDFAALLPETPLLSNSPAPLLRTESVQGTCRVICFSPRHDLSLPQMTLSQIKRVVDVWAEQILELGQKYVWVQVFENKGAIMGSSNPHPHGQVWAMNQIPNEIIKEKHNQQEYFIEHQSPLLVDYLAEELKYSDRVVLENKDWVVVVPFWAFWPYETLLLPRRHILRLPDLSQEERDSLAQILRDLLIVYDNLFETSFPYSMGWHGAPFLGLEEDLSYWQLHAHFYPPLLRSATVKKFMVGFEMLAEVQRDMTAEQAAECLREQKKTHYLERQ